MSKLKFSYTPLRYDGDKPHFHFFASSVGAWRTGTDLDKLLENMKRDRLPFNLFYLPVPEDAEYAIASYAPQVPGAVWLGAFIPG